MDRRTVRGWLLFELAFFALPANAAVGRLQGEFSVSQTGAAQYVIPLWVPPGTHGITPSLSLAYNHNTANGVLGVGWSIAGVSLISRCLSTWAQDGAPRDIRNDYGDRFCLDGNRLRLTSGTYGAPGATYQTEIETFSRITSHGAAGNGPQYFVVESKDGLIYEFGNSADSRIESVGQDSARTWALSKIKDRSGNSAQFSYEEDSTNGSFRLLTVQYTTNAAKGLTAAYAVNFVYETKSSTEVDTAYVAGSLIKEIKRINRVDVTYNGTLVRMYDMTYEASLSSAGRSRLKSVAECAAVDDCYPATSFTYQIGSFGLEAEVSTGAGVPAGVVPVSLDINGDGRFDIAYSSSATSGAGTWMFMLANSAGGYGSPVDTSVANTNFSGAICIDYNADGYEDLLVPYSGGTWWVMLGSKTGLGAPSNVGVPATGTGTNARAIDINGDGLDDLVWADLVGYAGGDAIRYRLRELNGTFSSTVYALVDPLEPDNRIVDSVFTGGRNFPARAPDFNGDGRADLAYRKSRRELQPETGRYFYTYSVHVICAGGWTFAAEGTLARSPLYFGDLNGDGKTDIQYYTQGGAWEFRLSRGTQLGPPQAGPGIAAYGAFALLDWDSDGYDDLLARATATGAWHLFRSTGESFEPGIDTRLAFGVSATAIADINGDGLADFGYASGGTWRYRARTGLFPDLLQTVTDGFSNSITVTYRALTQGVHTKGDSAVFPEQDYEGPLYVVSSYAASNGIGDFYSKSFSYLGARIHLQGRGFEGFHERVSRDDRTHLYQHETYHRSFPYTRALVSSELRQSNDATLISRAESSWAFHSYGSGFDTRHLPYVRTSTTARYELDGDYNGALISNTATANTVDAATGTITDSTTTVTESPAGNGAQSGQIYTQRTYVPALFTDISQWCIGRALSTQHINSHTGASGAAQARQIDVTWDGTYCRPTQTISQPGDAQLQVTTDLGYDDFGNLSMQVVTGAGMPARATTTSWGPTGQFPVAQTNALSQTSQVTWDYALGVPLRQSDPNGITVSWQYSAFGFRFRENRPDGTWRYWQTLWCADTGADCTFGDNTLYAINQIDFGSNDSTITSSTAYFDPVNRLTTYTSRSTFGELIDRRRIYDPLGRLAAESAPYFRAGGSQYFTSYTYDALNRVTHQSRPVSDTDLNLQTTRIFHEGLATRVVDPQAKQHTKVATVLGQLARTLDHNAYGQSFSYDAFGNQVQVVDTAGHTLQTASYNIRGMRTGSTDIDMGAWTYVPNALGEYLLQIDANSRTTTFTYDALSRPLTRSEPDGGATILHTYTWGASAAAKNIGKLEWVQIDGTSVLDNRQTYIYDSSGRLVQVKYSELGSATDYDVDQSYDSITGLLDSLTYPTSTPGYRLKLKYEYQAGQLYRIFDFNAPDVEFWRAYATDAFGQIADEELGNGLRTKRTFDAVTGWIDTIQTGPDSGASIQNLGYLFDRMGNLIQRQDNRQSLTENFFYDNLYRLDSSTLNGVANRVLTYDSLGNITSKSGIGAYVYDANKIHAVTTLGGEPAFQYDANGNSTGEPDGGFTFDYYPSNLPRSANWVDTEFSSTFQLDAHGERFQQIAAYPGGSDVITYIGRLLEKDVSGSVTSWKHYIFAPSGRVALYTRKSSGTPTAETYYFTRDHLGSIDSITNSAGAVEVRLSYDVHGMRRNEAGWTGAVPDADWAKIYAITHRGFTDHEMLDDLDVIHMNARLYDPDSGRFISADPFTNPLCNTQAFNRYSYIRNGALSATDPTGYGQDNGLNYQEDHQNGSLGTFTIGGSRLVNLGSVMGGMGSIGGLLGARHEDPNWTPPKGPDGPLTVVQVTATRPRGPSPPFVASGLVNLAFGESLLDTARGPTGFERRLIEYTDQVFDACMGGCMEALGRISSGLAATAGGYTNGGLHGAAAQSFFELLNQHGWVNAVSSSIYGAQTSTLLRSLTGNTSVLQRRGSIAGSIIGGFTGAILGQQGPSPGAASIIGAYLGAMTGDAAKSSVLGITGDLAAKNAMAAGLKGARGAAVQGIVNAVGTYLAEQQCEADCSQ